MKVIAKGRGYYLHGQEASTFHVAKRNIPVKVLGETEIGRWLVEFTPRGRRPQQADVRLSAIKDV